MMMKLTTDEIRSLFHYDPESGYFTWRVARTGGVKPGDHVGTAVKYGYQVTSVRGKSRRVHRLIWQWMTGDEPHQSIDHINRVKHDNRWANLRLATKQQQSVNRAGWVDHHKGVARSHPRDPNSKWKAEIRNGAGKIYLGSYDTYAEACAAYQGASRALHGDFVCFEHKTAA